MRQRMVPMIRLWALAAVTVISAVTAPSALAAHANRAADARRPATMAYSFPEQCVVLSVENTPFAKARALLARLGCRSRRVERASTMAKGLVVSVVGGERSYAFGHTVTLVVSSGPAQST